MTLVSDLKHYNDLRKFVPFDVFRAATTYISWHNRLTMTAMLEVWEALIVALVYEKMPIDELMFSTIKSHLDSTRPTEPATIDDCRLRAGQLIDLLRGN
jgi:hypothetical protein